MAFLYGYDVLSVFDVWEDTRDFLAEIIESGECPAFETNRLVNESLLAGWYNWDNLLSCARAIKDSKTRDQYSLDGTDILNFVWHILSGHSESPSDLVESWADTDRLIAIAQNLAKDPAIRGPSIIGDQHTLPQNIPTRRRNGNRIYSKKSHYWTTEPSPIPDTTKVAHKPRNKKGRIDDKQLPISSTCTGITTTYTSALSTTSTSGHGDSCILATGKSPKHSCRSRSSPYFAKDATYDSKLPKRPPAGVVSSITFPPLTADRFGIVQETLAHEPFWLLIAVTFLIKTKGQMAIPIFHQVRQRFPSPADLANPGNAEELSNMIRHLGLAVVRVAYIQKYGTAFMTTPPRPDRRYRVRNYDKRDAAPAPEADKNGESDAWEIGHMTQGKYALDSWRIFCRDELLGRASDWNGKGREPEFQPEWMRVMPQDKELRAYLRWLWMREGWEWDPATGERTVLREELRRAVDEGRVEYDNEGGLRILEVPQPAESNVA